MAPFRALAALAAAAVIASTAAFAQDYPTRPIRIVVPLGPGGSADIMARAIGDELTKRWGQAVIIDNMPGANSIIGTAFVARAKPDGYTLLMAYDAHAVNPHLKKDLAWDPIKDFQPVTEVAELPMAIVINPEVPAKTLQEFVALVKSAPDKYSYSSAGIGSSQHLVAVLFTTAAGITMLHVPYKEGAITGVISGNITMMMPTMISVLPHVQGGKVRALAMTSDKRVPQLPNVPTVDEALIPGFKFTAWIGLLAPAGTPRDIVNKLQTEIASILASPGLQTRFADKMQIVGSTPDAFSALIARDLVRWGTAVKAAGIQIE